ncbi:hypothetical protein [Nostoc sp. MG11]|uniref:hypothetical protein n=1 Tax=Nostoc sp. MG11 TaxID=2721166 RepID=UPI0018691121|nr:hypothetical protein [Nostoc sp. MG11]
MPRKKDLAESVMLTVIRKKSSLEGKVLEYIKETEQGGSDLALLAIMPRYKPYYLRKIGVRGEELRQSVLDAIADMEAEIVKLKWSFGMEGLAQVVLVQPTIASNGMGVSPIAINLVPPNVSFFSSNEASIESSQVESTVLNKPPIMVVPEEAKNLDDDSWLDDEEDVIPADAIEGDAGFQLR